MNPRRPVTKIGISRRYIYLDKERGWFGLLSHEGSIDRFIAADPGVRFNNRWTSVYGVPQAPLTHRTTFPSFSPAPAAAVVAASGDPLSKQLVESEMSVYTFLWELCLPTKRSPHGLIGRTFFHFRLRIHRLTVI